MAKRGLTLALSAFAICFYIAIIMYIFFAVRHIDAAENFVSAMIFQIIGFALLAYFILGNMIFKPIQVGFYVPLLMVTVCYTLLLDFINIAFAVVMPHAFFVLIHLVVLFIYCVISIPLYVMGRR